MTNNQQKKKKTEEVREVWNDLKEKILSRFRQLEKSFQSQLDQIFVKLLSTSEIPVPADKHFNLEEILVEIERKWERIRRLEIENLKLKSKLDGYGSGDGPGIEEVE